MGSPDFSIAAKEVQLRGGGDKVGLTTKYKQDKFLAKRGAHARMYTSHESVWGYSVI